MAERNRAGLKFKIENCANFSRLPRHLRSVTPIAWLPALLESVQGILTCQWASSRPGQTAQRSILSMEAPAMLQTGSHEKAVKKGKAEQEMLQTKQTLRASD